MIEIIPKPTAKVSLWLNILFYFSIGLLLISVLSVLILARVHKKADQTYKDLQEALDQSKSAVQELEDYVLGYQRKLNDFSSIVDKHRWSINLFSLLEENSHPRVRFTALSLNLSGGSVGLSGTSESVSALQQQLLIFEKLKEIKEVQLSNVSLGKQGGAGFSLNLTLDPEIFKNRNYETVLNLSF